MKKVIIIGASYAGLYAVTRLSKLEDVEVLIFDKNPYHYIQVESYGLVSNIYDQNKVTVNINKYINKLNANIMFYNEEVSLFDADFKMITSNNGKKYNYDYLIIATGSQTNFPPQVPNIRKYSEGIKNLTCANNIKKMFESAINDSIYSKNIRDLKPYNLVIGGAGLSGVEIAAEMAIALKKNSYLIPDDSRKINIIIVDGMKTVLPNMDERLITHCKERLDSLGITTHLGSFIQDVDGSSIYLANNTIVNYDYFIFTGGIKAVTIESNKTYEVNKLNQYIVNKHLQLKNEEDVFIIGDTAEILAEGKYVPPSAQVAIQSGEYVVDYIKSRMINKIIKPFLPKSSGILISLGGNYAIGLIYNKLFIRGFIAHILKKFVTYMHKVKFN